jgi:hypothetical protein
MWASDVFRGTLLSVALAAPAFGEPALPAPMTAEAFQAFVGTDTIIYGYATGSVGKADYGPDQTLVWVVDDGPCVRGSFQQEGEELCFRFDGKMDPACWHFYNHTGALYGLGTRTLSDERIFQISRSTEPLSCPEVGA